MPEGHAIAAFTQARAIAVPVCQNPMKQRMGKVFAASGLAQGRAQMNINSARCLLNAQHWCHAAWHGATLKFRSKLLRLVDVS